MNMTGGAVCTQSDGKWRRFGLRGLIAQSRREILGWVGAGNSQQFWRKAKVTTWSHESLALLWADNTLGFSECQVPHFCIQLDHWGIIIDIQLSNSKSIGHTTFLFLWESRDLKIKPYCMIGVWSRDSYQLSYLLQQCDASLLITQSRNRAPQGRLGFLQCSSYGQLYSNLGTDVLLKRGGPHSSDMLELECFPCLWNLCKSLEFLGCCTLNNTNSCL